MSGMDSTLAAAMARVEQDGLRRTLRDVEEVHGVRVRTGGRFLVNFASNDYLGLSSHPEVRAAAIGAVEVFGAGSGAARLLSGSIALHAELEAALAEWKGAPAALSFGSGFALATGVIPALVGDGDLVVLDRLSHACLVDGARLSRARLRVFAHNDPDDLDRVLRRARAVLPAEARILVVTESVFSMDGDMAPLGALCDVKDRHGAWLMVDEAHGTGVAGPGGRGWVAEWGLGSRVEVQMGTLGKALGSSGGFVCGSRSLVDHLISRCRSFLFSTAPVPAAVGAALASIRLVSGTEGERLRGLLQARIQRLRGGLGDRCPAVPAGAILPLPVGAERAALELARVLEGRGLWVPAVRYPTVGRGEARLRISLSALHSDGEVDQLVDAVLGVGIPGER